METAPRSETEILLLATAKEGRSLAPLAEGVDREDVLALLEHLRADEEGHRTRLLSLLAGMEEADQSVAATRLPAWLGSVPGTMPAAHPR